MRWINKISAQCQSGNGAALTLSPFTEWVIKVAARQNPYQFETNRMLLFAGKDYSCLESVYARINSGLIRL
jgi:hypothetical protein